MYILMTIRFPQAGTGFYRMSRGTVIPYCSAYGLCQGKSFGVFYLVEGGYTQCCASSLKYRAMMTRTLLGSVSSGLSRTCKSFLEPR